MEQSVSTSGPQTTAFAPIPEFARGPEIPASGYLLTDLGHGAYGITSGGVNTMFLVTGHSVVVVDAPLALGENLMAGIGEVTTKPVKHVIYSHAHADHTGSAHLLARDGVTIVAHEYTARFLAEARDPRRPLPDETFTGAEHSLDIDGHTIVLDYPGTWHQPGNLFVHFPAQRALAAIDTFTVRNAPFSRLLFTPHVPSYFRAMDQLLQYDVDTIVTGHYSRYGTPDDVRTNRAYVTDLRAAAAEALRNVDRQETTSGMPPDNGQAILKVWMRAVVARAVELVPDTWNERLGGTDVFLEENLDALAWSLLLD